MSDIFKPMDPALIERFKKEFPSDEKFGEHSMHFDGHISDLTVWSTALNPEQIRQLAEPAENSRKQDSEASPGLRFQWQRLHC